MSINTWHGGVQCSTVRPTAKPRNPGGASCMWESREQDISYVSASQTNLPPSAQQSENHLQPASRGKSREGFFKVQIAASAKKKKKKEKNPFLDTNPGNSGLFSHYWMLPNLFQLGLEVTSFTFQGAPPYFNFSIDPAVVHPLRGKRVWWLNCLIMEVLIKSAWKI